MKQIGSTTLARPLRRGAIFRFWLLLIGWGPTFLVTASAAQPPPTREEGASWQVERSRDTVPAEASPADTTSEVAPPSNRAGESRQDERSQETVLEAALTLYQAGLVEQAAEEVIRYVRQNPGSSRLALAYSRALGRQARFDHAIAFLRAHLAADENHAAALELGVLLSNRHEHEEAAELFASIPEEAGQFFVMAQMNLGKALRDSGRFEEARPLYLTMLEGPQAVFAHAALCEISLAEGQLDDCRGRLAQARQNWDDHPSLIRAAAYLAYLDGDLESATELQERLVARGSANARTLSLAILIAARRGQLERATRLAEALRTVTIKGERQALLAVLAALMGDERRAEDELRQALERNPTFATGAGARILLWRPELAETLSSLVAGRSPEATPQAVTPQGASEPTVQPAAGCCNLTDSRAIGAPVWVLLLLGLGALKRRSRVVLKADPPASS